MFDTLDKEVAWQPGYDSHLSDDYWGDYFGQYFISEDSTDPENAARAENSEIN